MRPIWVRVYIFFFVLLFAAGSCYAQSIKFIPNKGQWPQPFSYKSILAGGNIYIGQGKIYYHFADMKKLADATHGHASQDTIIVKRHALKLEWLNANKNCKITAKDAFPETYNYFLGKDPKNWKTSLHAYKTLTINALYKNIDAIIESDDEALKYTYFVAPGADASVIKLKINGTEKIQLQQNGNLYIGTSVNALEEQAPVAYQAINGKRKNVKCRFVLEGNVLSFALPEGYDKTKQLVIDPTVIFASFSGSTADNWGFTATYDAQGNAYGGGTVYDIGYPDSFGAFQDTFAGGVLMNFNIGDDARDIGIMKLSADGKKMLWATYLGGTHNEQPHSMIVDNSGRLVVFGTTYSKDFPVTAIAYDTSQNGECDIFVTKFSADGSQLAGSTFVGGSLEDGLNGVIKTGVRNPNPLGYNYGDQFRGDVIVDSSNNIYVASATLSKNFPVTTNAAQTDTGGSQDGCIFKLNSTLTKLVFSTYVGGEKEDAVYSLQLDTLNNIFACGGTTSPYFFKDTITYQPKINGTNVDGFLLHLKNDGSDFLNTTYIGTSAYDQSYLVQLDEKQNVFIYGQTRSTGFPIVKANYQDTGSGQFISKFNYTLDTLLVSSVFGSGRSTPDISPTAFLVDFCGRIYVSGWGGDVNRFPLGNGGNTKGMVITPDAFQKSTDGSDFYLATFAPDMDTILYASYFGGPVAEEHVDGGTSRFDKHGIVYQSVCGGCGSLSDFPTTTGAWSRKNKSFNCNNLVFKVNLQKKDIFADFEAVKPGCAPYEVKFKNKSIRTKAWLWRFGDGDSSTAFEPTHIFDTAGLHTIELIGYNPYSCSYNDTIRKQIQVYQSSDATFEAVQISCKPELFFNVPGYGSFYKWDFGDSTTAYDSAHLISHIYSKPGKYLVQLQADSGTLCSDSFSAEIIITWPTANFTYQMNKCKPVFSFTNTSEAAQKYIWSFGNGDSSNAINPVYTYKNPGLYEVTLIAIDSNSCRDSFSVLLNIADTARALFNIIPDACNHKIKTKNNSTLATTYFWSFGDGVTSTGREPEHIYKAAGKYLVRLYINRGQLCTDSLFQWVDISFPDAAFTHQFIECEPLVKFSNYSTRATNYTWSFGDGNSSTDASPTHRYKNPGVYVVKLISKDDAGCTDSALVEIKIADTAAAAFEIINDTCRGIVQFVNKSRLANTYLWNFGNGVTSSEENPTYIYPVKNRSYKVTLTINADSGCVDTTSLFVTPYEPPRSSFSYEKDSCTTEVKFYNEAYRGSTFLWLFGDGDTSMLQNPRHVFRHKGNYTTTLIINANTACADTFSADFFMPRDSLQKPFIPNVITPNNDGANDVLHVQLLAPCLSYEIEIYNRWGLLMYGKKGNVLEWDGRTQQGKPAPAGTYFYVFRSSIFGEQHGTITLIR